MVYVHIPDSGCNRDCQIGTFIACRNSAGIGCGPRAERPLAGREVPESGDLGRVQSFSEKGVKFVCVS